MKKIIVTTALLISVNLFADFPRLIVSDINKDCDFNADLSSQTSLSLQVDSKKAPTAEELTKVETSEIIAMQNNKIANMHNKINKAYRLALAYPNYDKIKLHKLSYFGKRLQKLKNKDASIAELEQFYTELKQEINKGK